MGHFIENSLCVNIKSESGVPRVNPKMLKPLVVTWLLLAITTSLTSAVHVSQSALPLGCKDNELVALKSHHGKYVVAEENGEANVNRATRGLWETWRVYAIGSGNDKVALKSAHGYYLVAEPTGGVNENAGFVNANRDAIANWETFTIRKLRPGYYSFKSYHGTYLVGMLDGYLNTWREPLPFDDWEEFQIECVNPYDPYDSKLIDLLWVGMPWG